MCNSWKIILASLHCKRNVSCASIHSQGLLNDCNSMSAEYLFQPDKHYDVGHDTGDKVIQCGRHNDIFKFWLMWRAKGMSGMEAQMDRLMALRKYQVTICTCTFAFSCLKV